MGETLTAAADGGGMEIGDEIDRVPDDVRDAATTPSEPREADPAAGPPEAQPVRETELLRAPLDRQAVTGLEAAAALSESLGLGYHLGGAVERIAIGAAGGTRGITALREASWLIERYISLVEKRPLGADAHRPSLEIAHAGEMSNVPLTPSAAVDARAAEREARRRRRSVERARAGQAAGAGANPSADLARNLLATILRSALILAALILGVLAMTLIGDWR